MFSEIDECATDTDMCDSNAFNCTNTDGGYVCICNLGFTTQMQGRYCKRIYLVLELCIYFIWYPTWLNSFIGRKRLYIFILCFMYSVLYIQLFYYSNKNGPTSVRIFVTPSQFKLHQSDNCATCVIFNFLKFSCVAKTINPNISHFQASFENCCQ